MMQNGVFNNLEDEQNLQLKKFFAHKSEKYDEAWDEDSGADQLILAAEILSQLFYDGEPNECKWHHRKTDKLFSDGGRSYTWWAVPYRRAY